MKRGRRDEYADSTDHEMHGGDFMSDRHKPHFGRATDGDRRVKQEDFEDKRDDVAGVDLIRDDIRLGGAVADTGPHAGELGEHITEIVEENRTDVAKATGKDREGADGGRRSGRHKGNR
jgi:hypothetical protein